ncbi:hypothetical protein [Stutzerimonas chloritidismutans]|nr:hypothetical protein [Pseudomonas aeruginosa]NRF47446.1 hypothetical protein [Stutzerimonas stutzeri]
MPIPELRPEDTAVEIKLGSLGFTFTAVRPSDLDMWGDFLKLPAGTLLLGTGTGGWGWGERFLIHETTDTGYATVDLRRGLVVEMPAWEVAASFCQLFSEEAYPYQSQEEAVAAVRSSIPLFALPAVVTGGDV